MDKWKSWVSSLHCFTPHKQTRQYSTVAELQLIIVFFHHCKIHSDLVLNTITLYTSSLRIFLSGNQTLKPSDPLTCSSVAVNLRLLVYRYGMKNSGTEAKWNVMFQRYKDSTLAQEKDKLLYGLASVEDVKLLNKYVQHLI